MRKRGISILEVVVAVNLAGLLVVFLIGLIPYSVLSLKRSGHAIIAANLAERMMEEIRRTNFSDILPGTYPPSVAPAFPPPPYPSLPVSITSNGFSDTRVYNFRILVTPATDISGSPLTDVKSVTVTVTWNERLSDRGVSGPKSFVLTSDILRRIGE